MPSGLLSRVCTLSLLSSVPMRKWPPTAARKSTRSCFWYHAELSSTVKLPQVRPFAKSCWWLVARAFSPWLRARALLCTRSASSASRSLVRPLGSPRRAVAPPTSAITLWPARWKWKRPKSASRCPTWSESAVGSGEISPRCRGRRALGALSLYPSPGRIPWTDPEPSAPPAAPERPSGPHAAPRARLLTGLGYQATGSDKCTATWAPPSWRRHEGNAGTLEAHHTPEFQPLEIPIEFVSVFLRMPNGGGAVTYWSPQPLSSDFLGGVFAKKSGNRKFRDLIFLLRNVDVFIIVPTSENRCED